MAFILASLFSDMDHKTGLGIFDTDSGQLCYLQVLGLMGPRREGAYRGACHIGDTLYMVTESSLAVIGCNREGQGPLFFIRHWVTYPGGRSGKRANLVAICLGPQEDSIYVGNNGEGSIDQLSLEGVLLNRRYLHECAPNVFNTPDDQKTSVQNHIRALFAGPDGKLYCTVAKCNGKEEGVVFSLDDGEKIVGELEHPHGGEISNGVLYVQNVQKGSLLAFNIDPPTPTPKPSLLFKQTLESNLVPRCFIIQNLRWTLTIDGVIYSGALNFGKNLKGEVAPSAIVGFDSKTGNQCKTISIPNLTGFGLAKPYALCSVPDVLREQASKIKHPIWQDLNRNTYKIATNRKSASENSDRKLSLTGKIQQGFPDEVDQGYISKQVEELDLGCKEATIGHVVSPSSQYQLTSSRMGKTVIRFDNVGLKFRQNELRAWKFWISGEPRNEFWAIRGLSFTVKKGETLGIIGRNGSGKSSTSLLCSGVYSPDEGTVFVEGLVRLLTLGVGFSNELSGRDNVFISGALLGIPRKAMRELIPEIEEFADIGAFINQPVRTYSAGMRSRLGFAISTAISCDILILDEAMSTGDQSFKEKAIERLNQVRERAGTVIMISHSQALVKNMCDRVIWLERGILIMNGTPKEVISTYLKFCSGPQQWLKHHPEYKAKFPFLGI